MKIVDLKKRLLKGDVPSYFWLPTERMWADLLTKEKKIPDDLENVLLKNYINLQETLINEQINHENQ